MLCHLGVVHVGQNCGKGKGTVDKGIHACRNAATAREGQKERANVRMCECANVRDDARANMQTPTHPRTHALPHTQRHVLQTYTSEASGASLAMNVVADSNRDCGVAQFPSELPKTSAAALVVLAIPQFAPVTWHDAVVSQ